MARPETASPRSLLPPYWRAARYEDERVSRSIYVRSQMLLTSHRGIDLTTTRLLLETGYHVAILGAPPGVLIERAIGMLMDHGTRAILTPFLLGELWQRHTTPPDFHPWMERHVRIP